MSRRRNDGLFPDPKRNLPGGCPELSAAKPVHFPKKPLTIKFLYSGVTLGCPYCWCQRLLPEIATFRSNFWEAIVSCLLCHQARLGAKNPKSLFLFHRLVVHGNNSNQSFLKMLYQFHFEGYSNLSNLYSHPSL